jgi:hypothetical protein
MKTTESLPQTTQEEPKKAYTPPELKPFGTVETLTQWEGDNHGSGLPCTFK